MGSGAKSYMKKGFLIYCMRKCANFSPYMRQPLVIYDFAPDHLKALTDHLGRGSRVGSFDPY